MSKGYAFSSKAILTGILAASLALSGCGAAKQDAPAAGGSGSSTPAAPAVKEVHLGSVLPLTGKEAKVGGAFKIAYEYALKEVNDAGGINLGGTKVPVKLDILDDTTDGTKSAQLVEQLITQNKVHAILGGYSTALIQAQSVVPDRYGIPFVNGGGSTSNIYGRSKWVFGTLAPTDEIARTQMVYLKDLIDAGKLPKPSKIALTFENTDHGKDYEKGVKEVAAKYPDTFQVVVDEPFELYAQDFKGLLTKVQNAKGDIFMADARVEDYITMHRQYTQMGLTYKMVTYGPRGAETAARDALGTATDYVFASSWWDKNMGNDRTKQWVAKYTAATKVVPSGYYDALAYETVRMLVKAIETAGSVDPEKIRDALTKVELTDSLVPGGDLKFSATGQAIYPFVVIQNKPGGKADIVWPKDAKTGDTVAPIPAAK